MLLGIEPSLQSELKLTELWRGLLLTGMHRFSRRVQMLAHHWPGEFKAASNRTNALAANQMLYPLITPQILRPKEQMVAHPGVETIGRCLPRESGKFCASINNRTFAAKWAQRMYQTHAVHVQVIRGPNNRRTG